MTTQELLTNLFNAIALGFVTIAAIDFGTRSVAAYKQITADSNSPKSATPQPTSKLPPSAIPPQLPQLPDPWLLPLTAEEVVVVGKLVQKEQNQLRLLLPAKAINVFNPKLEDLLRGVELDNLKLRQARKLAKVLGIAQKVNGRDQKPAFLVSQIKVKLQQKTLLKSEILAAIGEDLIAS